VAGGGYKRMQLCDHQTYDEMMLACFALHLLWALYAHCPGMPPPGQRSLLAPPQVEEAREEWRKLEREDEVRVARRKAAGTMGRGRGPCPLATSAFTCTCLAAGIPSPRARR